MKKNIIILVLAIFSVTLAFSQAIVRTKISSTPSDAEIYVDGSHIGHTFMEFRFRSGQMYKIELRKNNYRSQVFTYRGGSGNINKRLEALPPAKKPHRDPHKMNAPSYEHRKDHHKQNFHKPFKPHNNRPKPPHHKRKYTLIIKSDIPRAAVSIDRRYVGTTPLRIELEKGMHDVFVNLPGHRDYYEKVDLNNDKDIFIRFR